MTICLTGLWNRWMTCGYLLRKAEWFSFGVPLNSMSNRDNEPYAEGIPYCSSVLLYPQPAIDEPVSLPLTTGKFIDFLQVFPLTQTELDYKLQCADDEVCDLSPTDAMLDHFAMGRDHWIEYLMQRYSHYTAEQAD